MSSSPTPQSRTLWLGTRYDGTKGYIPLRSRVGNGFSSLLFWIASGARLKDTQTGLRGIPLSLIPLLLKIENNGFAFETEMLLMAPRQGYEFGKVPIKTVYAPGNPSSHFRPLQDTIIIFGRFIKFMAVGGASAALDYVIFAFLYWQTGEILASILCARALSAVFNFTMNRQFVFQSDQQLRTQAFRYITVCFGVALLSYALTKGLYLTGLSPFVGKMIADTIIVLLSYAGLRNFVFNK